MRALHRHLILTSVEAMIVVARISRSRTLVTFGLGGPERLHDFNYDLRISQVEDTDFIKAESDAFEIEVDRDPWKA